MSSSIFRLRRTKKVVNARIRHESHLIVPLHWAVNFVDSSIFVEEEVVDFTGSVIFVEQKNTIICASEDKSIRLYDRNTGGNPIAAFSSHSGFIRGLAQLGNDLVVSVSSKVLTWRVSNTRQVYERVCTKLLTAVAKVDDSHIVVGDITGCMYLLGHKNGTLMQVEHKFKEHSDRIYSINVYRNMAITCSRDTSAIVWHTKPFNLRTTLKHSEAVLSAAINDKHIITATRDAKLHVFENAFNFDSTQILNLPHVANHVQFLDDDIVALACNGGFFDFISLSQQCFVSRCKVSTEDLWSFALLPDARIAIVGANGFSGIFAPPEQVLDEVQAYVSQLYPSSQIVVKRPYPLCAAWDNVQAGTLSLRNACATIITSENCQRSLDEWCIAHNLLMQAVKSGDIPPSRHFNGVKFHWHQVLYHHCSKLALGEKDIGYLFTLFSQAEDAGVIDKGGAIILIEIISVRKDIVRDTHLITDSIYKLFLRQAQMDVRLQQILHYQKVQQLTSLINAIVGCIPIAGGIATNILSGGSSILNDFQICGLVESLMGTSSNCAAIGYDHLVDRFVRRSTQILGLEEWQKLSNEQRKAVEDAALNLGLTIDELRERLEEVAGTDQACSNSPETKIINDDLKISEKERNNCVSAVPPLANCETPLIESLSRNTEGVRKEDLVSELRSLEAAGLDKTAIQSMNCFEIATQLSAFLVMYNTSNARKFSELRNALANIFYDKSIKGRTFARSTGTIKKAISKFAVNAISQVVEKEDIELLSVLLEEFVNLLSSSSEN